MKRRSGTAQAALGRKAGPMKHRLEPRGGARDEQSAMLLEETCDGTYVDFQGAERSCLAGGEGCGLPNCPASHGPQG